MDENEGITVDVESGVEHVKEMWRCLGIGQKGYLTVSELGTVCRHIGMEDMQDWEVHQLFEQLDANGNGQVTFEEFMNEMFQHSSTAAEKITPLLTPTPKVTRTKSRRRKSFIRKTGMSTYESFFLSPGNSSLSFTTLDTNSRGFIKSDDLVELWESYGITNAVDVLKAYNIELDRELSHTKLAAVLEDELLFTADHSPKLQAAIITCLQECKNLRCLLEEASQEKDRLIIGLRESNIRSQILAEEDDERHAALEKTLQHRLQSVEGFYQEQIKNLKEELKKDREERMDMIDEHDTMIEKMNNSYEEDNKKLKETLVATQEDLRQTQAELNESRERLRDMEKQKHKLQYQLSVEKLKAGGKKSFSEQKELMQVTSDAHSLMRQQISQLQEENKILGDRLEELSPQNRRPNHRKITGKNLARSMSLREQSLGEMFPGSIDILNRITPRGTDRDEFSQMQRELKQLKKNIEIEHKEIEHAYLIEIAQIEERHSYEMAETLKQATKEKEKLLEEQAKRQQERLAKLEKELQTQFAIEKQDLLLKHESEKNLLEQKLAEDKIRLTEMLRSEYMEDLQRKIRELERCFNNEREQWKKLGWPVRQESPDTNPVNPVELARTAVSLPLALDNAPSPGSEGFSETSSNSFTTISVAQSTGSATLTGVAVSTVNTVSSCSSISSGSGGVGGGSSEITFATCSVSSSVDNPPPPPCPSSLPKNVSFSKDKDEDASIPTDSTGPRAMYTLPDDIQEVTLECVPHHYCTKNTRNSGTKENEGIIDNDDNDVDDDDSDCDSGSSENLASRRRNSMTIFDDYKANDSKSYEDDVVDGSPDIPSREPQQQQQQSQQQRQEPSDGNQKKVIIQLCCMEQLHNVDNIQLQRIFDKDMDAKLKDAFMKALTKHRNEELQRSNKLDQDETATECNDFADNRKFQRLWVRRASDEPKPKLSPLQRCREKVLKMENDRRQLTQKYEDKLRQQDRELQKLRNKFVEMSDTPKDYSVKTAVTKLGYHLLFPRQKYNKSTQTDRRGHLHRNMSDLHLKCFYQEEKLYNLEKELTQREEHSNTIMKKVEDTYRNVINEIEGEREQLKHKLISTEEAFQDQSGKLLEQQSKSKNRDLLLKDLYLQNAELMRSLQQLEEQLRIGDQKNMQLEEKCRVLDKVLQKILVDDAYDDLVPDSYKNNNNTTTNGSSNNNNNDGKKDEVKRKSGSGEISQGKPDVDRSSGKNRNRKLFEFGRNKKQFERNLQDRKKRELFLKTRHLSCEFFTSLKNPYCENMADIYQCNVESGFILDEISRVMENMFQFLDAGLSKERDSLEFANANNLASKETACREILRRRELGSLQDSTQNLGENQTHSVSLSEEFPRIDVYTDAEEDEIGIRVDTGIKDGEDDTISYSDDYSLEFNRSTHLDVVDQTIFSTYSNSVNSLKEEIYEQLDSCQTASSYVSADENIIANTQNDSDEAEYAGSCVSKNISDSATNRTYTCNYVPKTVKERDKHEGIGVNDEYNDDDDDDDDANYDDLSFDNETDATEIDESVFADDSDDYAIDMGVVCEDFEFHSNSKHSDSPNAEERNDVNVRLLAIKENQPMVKFELESINEETLESKSSEILEIENEAAEMKKIAVQIKHWAEKIEKEVVKIENVTEEIGQNIEQDVYMETKDEEIQKNSEVIRKDDQNDNELGEDESKTVQVENDCSEIDMKETNSVWLTDDERELIASQSRMEFLEELSVNYSILQRFLLISDDPTTGAMILPVVRWMWDIFKRMQY